MKRKKRHSTPGRCSICRQPGHIARHCPEEGNSEIVLERGEAMISDEEAATDSTTMKDQVEHLILQGIPIREIPYMLPVPYGSVASIKSRMRSRGINVDIPRRDPNDLSDLKDPES